MKCDWCNKVCGAQMEKVLKGGNRKFFCSTKCKKRWQNRCGRGVELFCCGAGI